MFNQPSLQDLVKMIDHIPGYKPSDEQKTLYRKFKEAQKRSTWLARQEMKEVDGFKEPFDGWCAGIDLWPEGAPAAYYKSQKTSREIYETHLFKFRSPSDDMLHQLHSIL